MIGQRAHRHFVCACARGIRILPVRRHMLSWARFRAFSTGRSTLLERFFSREMKDYNKFTYISDTMDTRGVCWGLGWGYLIDQSANRTRKRTKEVEFDIGFTEVQDVHIRRQTVKVSLKMLKLYCYELRGCILSRSSDTWAYERREFGISSYFTLTSKSICVKFPAAPKLQIT